MNTKVSITLRPDEFDLIREAVESMCVTMDSDSRDEKFNSQQRHEARQKAGRLADLSAKLNS
jgi:hypothetical protein